MASGGDIPGRGAVRVDCRHLCQLLFGSCETVYSNSVKMTELLGPLCLSWVVLSTIKIGYVQSEVGISYFSGQIARSSNRDPGWNIWSILDGLRPLRVGKPMKTDRSVMGQLLIGLEKSRTLSC